MAPVPVPDPVIDGRVQLSSIGHSGPAGYAPGRVNLIGEHLDYNGGPSLPIAIPYWTYVAATQHDSPGLWIDSAGHDGYADDRPAGAEREPGGTWCDYVLGTLQALRAEVELPSGLTLTIVSTLPAGAGLSSSASLTIACALAIDGLLGGSVLSRATVSRVSRQAENDFVGAPTGDLDQCAILGARPDSAVLCQPGQGPARRVPWSIDTAGLRLLVVPTGVRHDLSDGGYASRVEQCRSASQHLGVEWLCDPRVTAEQIEGLESEVERRRARHVVTEKARVEAFTDALDRGDAEPLGRLMLESHASLRDDYEVSCPELDLVVEASVDAGAVGARMTGGGFGGSAIVLTPTERVDAVVTEIRAGFADRDWSAPTFLDGHAVGRAGTFSV